MHGCFVHTIILFCPKKIVRGTASVAPKFRAWPWVLGENAHTFDVIYSILKFGQYVKIVGINIEPQGVQCVCK